MAIDFKSALGIHENALLLRGQRSAILSNNLVNSDTPGYFARDLDFSSILKNMGNQKNILPFDSDANIKINTTHSTHIPLDDFMGEGNIKYRIPINPSQDGNTVDPAVEYVKFSENSLRYEASLQFLGAKFTGLLRAIKGEAA